ncbi:MAG: ABC transporter permease subunit, partial [Cyanobacteria bacterium]|nr:ABC transporter permease subunit [Cyanobacteriota bacterium]
MSAGLPDLSPLWLSLRSAALAVLLVVPLGFLAARQVSRWQGSRRAAADLLLLSPLVLPPTVLGFLLLQLLGRYGPVGAGLALLGLEIVFSWPATVLSSAVVAFPLLYRTLLAAFDQMDPSLEAVALSLWASPWRVQRVITLPLLMPGPLVGISLA